MEGLTNAVSDLKWGQKVRKSGRLRVSASEISRRMTSIGLVTVPLKCWNFQACLKNWASETSEVGVICVAGMCVAG